jgi:putative membrane protein
MFEVRERVPELTGILTVVSLALVFGAVGGAIPSVFLPRAPDSVIAAIPHVNAVVSLAAIGTIFAGIKAIRDGRVSRHRRLMLATFSLFVVFLVLYLYRVTLVGPTEFGGPAVLETYLYFPLLAIHILLAIVAIPLVYYTLLLAVSHPISELPQTNHPRAGRVAASLWLVSFTLGVVVYAMLYVVW